MVQLAVLLPSLDVFHTLVLKWSYVLHVGFVKRDETFAFARPCLCQTDG
jgi:hypothetical protein